MKNLPKFLLAAICIAFAIGCTSNPKEPEKDEKLSPQEVPPLDDVLKVRAAQVEPDISGGEGVFCLLPGDTSHCVVITENDLDMYDICYQVICNPNVADSVTLQRTNITIYNQGSVILNSCTLGVDTVVLYAGGDTTLSYTYCSRKNINFQPGDSIVFDLFRTDQGQSRTVLKVCPPH
ncbi:MAG: hypothetical protein H6563_13965 [Lewinellaceae bacterium]|nr:hypothetical protein [Lewinellaceae bacterium]